MSSEFSNNCRDGIQSKTRQSEKNEKLDFSPIKLESQSMKLLTKNFSNAKYAIMNKRRTTKICMYACLLAIQI